MLAYRLSKSAEKDLAGILRYTTKTWSQKQADIYLESIAAARDRIAENPSLLGSQTRENFAKGCRTFLVGKHLIFYRVDGELLIIPRILHEPMNLPNQLKARDFE